MDQQSPEDMTMLARTNRSLTRVNPLETPRDPAPARLSDAPLTRIYRIGDAEPLFCLCAAPRIFGRIVPLTWSEKARIIADYFQASPDDVISTREMSDGTELILVGPNIVGSFDRPMTVGELLAESARDENGD
jgi:hypothetical protein